MLGWLLVLFFVTAGLYASVGFGGGSTYNALLVLGGVDYGVLPVVALACNWVVVSGGAWRFWRAGVLDGGELRRLLPFVVASVPMAWLGGRWVVAEVWFMGLLGGALLWAGGQLAWQSFVSWRGRAEPGDGDAGVDRRGVPWGWAVVVGGVIGLLSGVVGIGGGVFLAPWLYRLGYGGPRQIAAAASVFIWVNSMSGLAGQWSKRSASGAGLAEVWAYWPLVVSVLVGGQLGSWLSARALPSAWVKGLTAVLILYVGLRLAWRWVGMVWVGMVWG